MSKTAIRKAAKAAGGYEPLARAIRSSPQLVRYWCVYSKKGCSPNAVLRIEAATGVSRHDLRPDIYPRDEAVA